MQLWRLQQRKTLRVIVAELSAPSSAVAKNEENAKQAKLGLSVRALSPQEMAQAQVQQG